MMPRSCKIHGVSLRPAVLGELDSSSVVDRRTLRELESCETCREVLAELRGVKGALRIVRHETEALTREARDTTAPGEDLAVAAFVRRMLSQRGAQRSSWIPWLAVASIMAALAGIALGPGLFRHASGPPVTLGSSDVECLSPLGEVSSFDRFEWRQPGVEAVSYDLRVFNLEGVLVLERRGLRKPSWMPDDLERSRLPGSIVWEVIALDSVASSVAAGMAEARLTR